MLQVSKFDNTEHHQKHLFLRFLAEQKPKRLFLNIKMIEQHFSEHLFSQNTYFRHLLLPHPKYIERVLFQYNAQTFSSGNEKVFVRKNLLQKKQSIQINPTCRKPHLENKLIGRIKVVFVKSRSFSKFFIGKNATHQMQTAATFQVKTISLKN